MKQAILGLILALLISRTSSVAQTRETKVLDVSYCDLVKAPQSFTGKRLRVRAIYKYGFEIQRLDPPVCCPESKTRIWVEIDKNLSGNSAKQLREFRKDMGLTLATFVGTIESSGPYGDGGYPFLFNVTEIGTVEATAKPSPDHDPAWVPNNCGPVVSR